MPNEKSANSLEERLQGSHLNNMLFLSALGSKSVADLFELNAKDCLLQLNHYSNYFKIEPLWNTSSSNVITHCKSQFDHYSMPDELITGNSSHLISVSELTMELNVQLL